MIGDKISKIRTKKCISQSELARRCGMAVSSLHNIETGVSGNPGWYTVCKIAQVLEVEITAFLD